MKSYVTKTFSVKYDQDLTRLRCLNKQKEFKIMTEFHKIIELIEAINNKLSVTIRFTQEDVVNPYKVLTGMAEAINEHSITLSCTYLGWFYKTVIHKENCLYMHKQ